MLLLGHGFIFSAVEWVRKWIQYPFHKIPDLCWCFWSYAICFVRMERHKAGNTVRNNEIHHFTIQLRWFWFLYNWLTNPISLTQCELRCERVKFEIEYSLFVLTLTVIFWYTIRLYRIFFIYVSWTVKRTHVSSHNHCSNISKRMDLGCVTKSKLILNLMGWQRQFGVLSMSIYHSSYNSLSLSSTTINWLR